MELRYEIEVATEEMKKQMKNKNWHVGVYISYGISSLGYLIVVWKKRAEDET